MNQHEGLHVHRTRSYDIPVDQPQPVNPMTTLEQIVQQYGRDSFQYKLQLARMARQLRSE